MYAVTSVPLDSRTRAILRSAEFGFFGVIVLTCKQTPRFCGHPCMAGCFGFDFCGRRGLRINWLIVGMNHSCRPAIHVGRSYWPLAPVQGEVIILIGAWTPGQWGIVDFWPRVGTFVGVPALAGRRSQGRLKAAESGTPTTYLAGC